MSSLSFQRRGQGRAVILLHGFPFHNEIWNSFATKLSAGYDVFTPDLPGFGKSAMLKSTFGINDVADAVVSWVRAQRIDAPVLIGHSLGGYVALAAAANAPALFSGLGLFHSTAYADSEEKKQSRDKVLEFIAKNGVHAFTSNFIGPLFVDQNHPAIATVKAIAAVASAEAVTGYTKAMRDRGERTDVVKNFDKPMLFLAGEKDAGIPTESITRQASIARLADVHILPETAHMGMFENEKKCLEIIQFFIEKTPVTT